MLERQGSANIKEGDSVQVCRPIEVQAKVIAQLIVEAKRAARHINADAKKLGKQQAIARLATARLMSLVNGREWP